MTISLIVAISENGVIGRDGGLPWRLPVDLKHFKRLTMGHSMLMGRRTLESIGRALPGRTSIVLTTSDNYDPPEGVLVASSLPDAMSQAAGDALFVCGGASVYREALPFAERLYVTRVHASVEGDTFFPDEWLEGWVIVDEERVEADERNEYAVSFRVLERTPAREPHGVRSPLRTGTNGNGKGDG